MKKKSIQVGMFACLVLSFCGLITATDDAQDAQSTVDKLTKIPVDLPASVNGETIYVDSFRYVYNSLAGEPTQTGQ